ncbi:MAG: hypothetical protein NT150_13665 [Bacteroidetes bacterium]|nr:hypothetical protein [Bacteroidota bacterium]
MIRGATCFLFFFLAACTYEKIEPVKDCGLPETVSFSKDVLPLLNANCSYAGCHSGVSPAGGLDLADSVAYKELLKPGSGYVDTLNPSFSILYAQMKSTSNPMPPSGKLDDCKLQLILKWLEQKAKNN